LFYSKLIPNLLKLKAISPAKPIKSSMS